MFIAECDIDEVRKEASKLLKNLGIKHRFKKLEFKLNEKKETVGVFKIRLEKLRQKKVRLKQYDQFVNIPAFLVDSCNYLRDRIETDGLFRKPGVAVRQKEIKQILLSGGRLSADCEHSATDVADLLKLFFRELPEPCIPYIFHEALQRCLLNKEAQREAILLVLLLLPSDYLYTLAYLMQFLEDVAAHWQSNRMDVNNLAIVWTPNLMPFKTGHVSDKQVLEKRLAVVQFLIENSNCIGVVPEILYEHLATWQPSSSLSSHDELESSRHREKKKKRRSGSLTRMISGIKKMVRRSGSEEHHPTPTTPEHSLQHTPCIMSTGKKRKASEANLSSFSAKKSLTKHPQMEDPKPKRRSRFHSYIRSPEGDGGAKAGRSASSSKLRLSHFGLGRKHKKKSLVCEDHGLELLATPNALDLNSSSEDYVRISRSEYEDIKTRVSRIESRISSEFENIVGVSMSDLEMSPDQSVKGSIQTVQSAYEKTLESAEKFNSPTSDELARRFSRELKIRGSSEKKVIRSPSARKIGSLRRRSKENVPQIKRNLSLNVPTRISSHHQFYPNKSLRSGKSITVTSGLPNPLFNPFNDSVNCLKNVTNRAKSESFEGQSESLDVTGEPCYFDFNTFGVLTRSQARRASSFHGCDLTKVQTSVPSSFILLNNNQQTPVDLTDWKDAEVFLKEEKTEDKSVTGRPSVAKLRSQNAGMVLAKAKLFNTMVDADNSDKTKSFKSNKPCDYKSREIKKRNSSKSSKERRLQRKDSRNGVRRGKRENSVPKQSIELSTNLLSKNVTLRKENLHTDIGKENLSKRTLSLLQNSPKKTPLKSENILQSRFRENINDTSTAEKINSVTTPLRELNQYNLPGSGSRKPKQSTLIGRSPKVSQPAPTGGRATINKHVSTPRRSPRHLLNSRQLQKQV